jgi:hypothetical protein
MSNPFVASALRAWSTQRGYVQRLTADLSDADMVSQPVPGITMNHPAWVLSHCGIYPPVIAAILEGRSFEDPIKHKFGRESRPSTNPADYPKKEALLAEFFAGQDKLAEVLARTDLDVFTRPIPLERWKARFPVIADVVFYLMLDHQAGHLGQISAWRRAGGRPAV